jgi:hypothetical protein
MMGCCCRLMSSALSIFVSSLQFPGSKEEEGLQREPEGAKQARAEGRTPAVDTPEEAAAPAHEYEFQPQVSLYPGNVVGVLAMVGWASGSRSFGMHCQA